MLPAAAVGDVLSNVTHQPLAVVHNYIGHT